MSKIKICGLTHPDDVALCTELGVDGFGFNFVPGTPRCLTVKEGRELVLAADPEAVTVGVFANSEEDHVRSVMAETGLKCAQLHGDESPEYVRRLGKHAYKALRIGSEEDVHGARAFGDYLLVDARVKGVLGGSGKTFNWDLVTDLAAQTRLVLAGGLGPHNVARAIAHVRPYCVDVASGVEGSFGPRRKDPALVREFVARARQAFEGLANLSAADTS